MLSTQTQFRSSYGSNWRDYLCLRVNNHFSAHHSKHKWWTMWSSEILSARYGRQFPWKKWEKFRLKLPSHSFTEHDRNHVAVNKPKNNIIIPIKYLFFGWSIAANHLIARECPSMPLVCEYYINMKILSLVSGTRMSLSF